MLLNNSTHQNWPPNPDWYKKPPAEESCGPFSPENPLKIFVMFHDGASAIRGLHDSYHYGGDRILIGALTDNEKAKGISFFQNHSIRKDSCQCKNRADSERQHQENKCPIPCIALDWASFQSENHEEKRDTYFQFAADILAQFDFDIIVFSGFLRIVPGEFIRKFEGRILNVHPADLTVLDPETGKRRYVGQGRRAIQRTIDDGQEYIRSTVAFVECGDPDEGEIIALSKPCKIIPGEPAIQLQDRLKKIGDSDALNQALSKIVSGEVLIPQRKPVKQRELA